MIYLLFGGATAYISYYYSNNIKNWISDKSYNMYNYFYPKFIKDNIKVENIILLIFDENYDNIISKKKLNIDNSLLKEYNIYIDSIKNKNIYKSLDKYNIILLFEYYLTNIDYNPTLYRFNYPLYISSNNTNKNINLTDYIKSKIIYLDNLFNIYNKNTNNTITENIIENTTINDTENTIDNTTSNVSNNINLDDYEESDIVFISQKCDNTKSFKLLSIDYNNSDITDIFKSYSGFNNDYHHSIINFKTILDENYTQLYNSENYINIIYNNLDVEEINLKKNNYILNKFL